MKFSWIGLHKKVYYQRHLFSNTYMYECMYGLQKLAFEKIIGFYSSNLGSLAGEKYKKKF
jgi:hypothetical protein